MARPSPAVSNLEALRARLRSCSSSPDQLALKLGVPAIDDLLPDGGLPRAAVVELVSPSGLARATQLALLSCAAAQEADRAWCAWVEAAVEGGSSLYAPGVARAGVELSRLLVVRPDPGDLMRVAVRLTSSRLFSLVVLDRARAGWFREGRESRPPRWDVAVRRLSLAAEGSATTVLLLSDSRSARETLPTALRIELSRPSLDRIDLAVTKDRRGRLHGPMPVPLVALQHTLLPSRAGRLDRSRAS